MCADNDTDHDGCGNDKNDDIEDEGGDLNEVDNNVFLFPIFRHHMFKMGLPSTNKSPETAAAIKPPNRSSFRCVLQLDLIPDGFRSPKCLDFQR